MASETGQWHPVAYYLWKLIPAKTCYETHNAKLLAIVKAFKNWCYYLEDCKYKVLVLTDHNNVRRFIDTKSLSSHQIRWAQELFCYCFRINYCQSKPNRATDALSCYFQRSQGKEKILQAENRRIFQHLQSWLTNAWASSTSHAHVASLKHVIICRAHAFPNLCQS